MDPANELPTGMMPIGWSAEEMSAGGAFVATFITMGWVRAIGIV